MSTSDSSAFAGLRDEYLAEAGEHLQGMQRVLLAVEGRPGLNFEGDELNELFRRFHTLKGMSAMMEVEAAERLCHQAEAYLRELRDGRAQATDSGLDELVSSVRLLEEIVSAFRAGEAQPTIDAAVLGLAAVMQHDGAEPTRSEPAQRLEPVSAACWRVEYRPTPELAQRGVSVNEIRARLGTLGTIRSATPKALGGGAVAFEFLVVSDRTDGAEVLASWSSDGLTAEPVAMTDEPGIIRGPAAQTNAVADSGGRPQGRPQLVRVDLARLDSLMRTVGDLVVSRARLEAQLRSVANRLPVHDRRALAETTQTLSRQLRSLREGVMRVRLVPVRDVFERMRLVVRDLARSSGRPVTLELEGADTEIDKFLIERLMDPLLHIVRNAVAHGLEPPEQRVAAGKPAEGRISLSARTQGDNAVVSITDDGRGIDAERVAARSRQFGIAIGAQLGAEQLLDLLCLPGFSTRDVADRVSGRGVGLSVARTAVEDLGGTLQLDTTPGRGTTFTITLPLTLAITDALLVAVGPSRFAVPQAMIREVIETTEAAITRSHRAELVLHRGNVVPLVRLQRLFGLESPEARDLRLLLVGDDRAAVGIGVDRVLGIQEVVVHTIRDPLIAVPGIAGATELGDGNALLILDVAELAAMARGSTRQPTFH